MSSKGMCWLSTLNEVLVWVASIHTNVKTVYGESYGTFVFNFVSFCYGSFLLLLFTCLILIVYFISYIYFFNIKNGNKVLCDEVE